MVQAFGHLSAQMLEHILLMNAVAPLLALALRRRIALQRRFVPRRVLRLAPVTVLQLAALWAWHAPPALAAASRSDALHVAMQVSLFGAALWFWLAIVAGPGARWRAILALLVTGKLFCLMGALLAFAPRALYPGLATTGTPSALADQQLAGLLMLGACPAVYVVAGVVIAARWLARIDAAAVAGARAPHARHPA